MQKLASRFSLIVLALTFTVGCAKRDGITVHRDGHVATASVVSPNVFRIEAEADPRGKVAKGGRIESLKTQRGVLQIDTANATWSLADAKGNTITPFAPLTASQNNELAFPIGWPTDRPFTVYGGGNDGPSLLHASINSRVGNGLAVQPFFWSPLGFATYAVSENADRPMRCDGLIDGKLAWHAPGSRGDLYIILAPTFGDAVRSYNKLTGTPPVPPLWTFGYQQSRWGWKDRAYVSDTLAEFTKRKLPVDAFIFDFEWYTSYPDYLVKPPGEKDFSDFHFNAKVFPDPKAQIAELRDAGVKFVGIRKPRLGNADTLTMARSKNWIVSADPREPFESRNLNFEKPAVRNWYSKQMQPLLRDGIGAWWNDEGELTYTTYARWNEAEIDALKQVRPNARHWSLNRAFSPGMQAMGAAAWTGDVHAAWDVLQRTPADLLNWSMSGMTYATCDIGGYHGETNPELFTRWMQAGVFFPVMRSHAELKVKPHFPWLFGTDAERAMKRALELRYRLVPYFYTLAHEAHATGTPIMRPLVDEFPNDEKCAAIADQWMIGRLMPAPVLSAGGKRSVYLPPGEWFDFNSNNKLSGGRSIDVTASLDSIPIYVRAGTILPLGPIVQRTRDIPSKPLELRIYPGADATFTLVEDDGETNDYTRGKVRRTTFRWDDAQRALTWERTGEYDGANAFTSVRVVVVGSRPGSMKEIAPLQSRGDER